MISINNTRGPNIKLPLDDYIFNMVIKQGRAISRPGQSLFVEALEIDGLVFSMTLLDSTTIASENETFKTIGLVGQWKLLGLTNRLKLVKACSQNDAQSVRTFLLDEQSHESVRLRYNI